MPRASAISLLLGEEPGQRWEQRGRGVRRRNFSVLLWFPILLSSNPSLTVQKCSGLPGQWILMNPSSDGTWVRGRQLQAAHLLQARCQESLPSQMCVFNTASHLPCCYHMPMAPGHSHSVPPSPPVMMGRNGFVSPVSSLSAGTPSSGISMLPPSPCHFHPPRRTPDSHWEISHHAA